MRRCLLVILFVPVALAGLATEASATENDYGGGPDENTDVATPGTAPVDDRPTLSDAASPQILAADVTAARVVGPPIEDFKYDALVLEGTAREVCAGRLLPGSGWTYNELVKRFGGTPGTLYYCRERWDTATDPACNGQTANPVTSPNFFSTCWSNHAQGRAIDIMVGRVTGGYNHTRGVNIVNWLLAPDAHGNVNATARALGIQQILFADRCWNSDGDRGIASWSRMRECGIGHHDHVHLDLTVRGANGTVSYWGAAPEIAPKLDTQVFWHHTPSWRHTLSWWNLRATDEEGLSLPWGYDKAIVGDWDSDGLLDEIIMWDKNTGNYVVQNWNDGDSLNARVGRFSTGYDEAIAGDWDSDGRFDDLIVWSRATGGWTMLTWSNYTPRRLFSQRWSRGYTQLINGDFDGDGKNDDSVLWNGTTGHYLVWSWQNFDWTQRYQSDWGVGYDFLIPADLSAGGELDESILWDRQTGRFHVLSWTGFRPRSVYQSRWSLGVNVVAPGDYDTDGRVDDLFLYSSSSGRWWLYSFHRNVPALRLTGTWLSGYTVISVGSFLN